MFFFLVVQVQASFHITAPVASWLLLCQNLRPKLSLKPDCTGHHIAHAGKQVLQELTSEKKHQTGVSRCKEAVDALLVFIAVIGDGQRFQRFPRQERKGTCLTCWSLLRLCANRSVDCRIKLFHKDRKLS